MSNEKVLRKTKQFELVKAWTRFDTKKKNHELNPLQIWMYASDNYLRQIGSVFIS